MVRVRAGHFRDCWPECGPFANDQRVVQDPSPSAAVFGPRQCSLEATRSEPYATLARRASGLFGRKKESWMNRQKLRVLLCFFLLLLFDIVVAVGLLIASAVTAVRPSRRRNHPARFAVSLPDSGGEPISVDIGRKTEKAPLLN